VVLDQPENVSIMPGEQEGIVIKLEVSVAALAGEATVSFPPELRPTERLVHFLSEALSARDLILKHWRLSPEQQKELESLSNVLVVQAEEK
jgi:hypothetical protein